MIQMSLKVDMSNYMINNILTDAVILAGGKGTRLANVLNVILLG